MPGSKTDKEYSGEEPSLRFRRTSRRESAVVAAANLFGTFLIVFYFANLHFAATSENGGISPLFVSVLVAAGMLIVSGRVSERWRRPFNDWYRQATTVDAKPGSAPPDVRRLALNMPLFSALVNLVNWFLAGLIMGFGSSLSLETWSVDWGVFLQIFTGAEIAGMTTSLLVYFAIERVWHSELPLFFPNGNLSGAPAFKLSVRRRMLVVFLLSTFLLINLGFLAYLQAVRITQALQPAALLPRMLGLVLFLVGSSLLVSVVLARTLGSSLVEPLETLAQRMSRVAQGELNERVEVTSNDEVGSLSEHFNYMVANLEQREIELHTVYQISRDITASLELDHTLQTILDRVRQMIVYDEAEICLFDLARGVLQTRAQVGEQGVLLDPGVRTCRLGEGYTGWVAEQLHSLLVEDVAIPPVLDPALAEPSRSALFRSYLGVPLQVGETLVGTLELMAASPGTFDEHDRQLLETIVPGAAIAIQNAIEVLERERRLREQIEKLRIEIDEVKRQRQVKAITGADSFQKLLEKARQMRQALKQAAEDELL